MGDVNLGDKFSSYEELMDFKSNDETVNYIQLYVRTSQSAEYYNKNNPKKEIPQLLKYSRIEFACIHGGKKFTSESTGKRPNTSTFKMECPFRIKLSTSKDGKSLQVKELEKTHNHEIHEIAYRHLPRQRKLDDETKVEAKKMLKLKANKKLVQEHIRSTTGKIITMRDIHNIVNDRSKSTESETLQTLLDEMKKVPGSTVEIKKDDSNLLTGIFYQDPQMHSFFEKFPEILLIDATYKMNELRLPLFVLVCVDGNGESEIVAFWVVSDESKETLRDMIQIFKKYNPGWENIQCIMSDKDMTERQTLQDEIPAARLQICLFHVLRTFKREVTCEKLKISADVRLHSLEILQKLAYCKSSNAYDELYLELQDANTPSVLKYLFIF